MRGRIIYAYGCSSKGKVRLNNEDSFILNGQLCKNPQQIEEQNIEMQSKAYTQYYGVFDGIGGGEYGERASFTAASILKKLGNWLFLGNVKNKLEKITERMNQAVIQKIGDRVGGSTVAMAVLRGNKLFVAHAGDSRVYLMQKDHMTQITIDHTTKPLFNKKTGITVNLHMLNRYVGDSQQGLPICEVTECPVIEKGDRLLLCSDGLTDMLKNQEIYTELRKNKNVKVIGNRLLERAMEAGGKDNITLIVLQA